MTYSQMCHKNQITYAKLTVFLNDIFFFVEKTIACNFIDYSTICSCGKVFQNVIDNLKWYTKVLLNNKFQCTINSVTGNPTKFQFCDS